MIVRVKLFAVAKEIVGSDVLAVEVSDGATIGEVRNAMMASVPELKRILDHSMIAVGAEYARDDTKVNESSEIALIPPVSGG